MVSSDGVHDGLWIIDMPESQGTRRESSTKLIRIEGRNVEKIRRFPYEKA